MGTSLGKGRRTANILSLVSTKWITLTAYQRWLRPGQPPHLLLDYRLRSCRFCSSRLAPFAICSAALRLDSTTGCAAFRQQSPQIAFTRCNEKHKSRKLTKIGLSFGGGFPLQGAGYGDAGAFRKSARITRGYLSRPPTVTRCGSLPRTKCRSVVSDL